MPTMRRFLVLSVVSIGLVSFLLVVTTSSWFSLDHHQLVEDQQHLGGDDTQLDQHGAATRHSTNIQRQRLSSVSTRGRRIQQNNDQPPKKQNPANGEIDVTSPPLAYPSYQPTISPSNQPTTNEPTTNEPTPQPSDKVTETNEEDGDDNHDADGKDDENGDDDGDDGDGGNDPSSQPTPAPSTAPPTEPPQPSEPPVQPPSNEVVVPPTSATFDDDDLGRLPLIVESIADQINSGSDGSRSFIDIEAILSDPSSYQYKAMKRTMEQSYVEEMSDEQLLQHWILFCIYCSTNGDSEDGTGDSSGWIRKNGWKDRSQDPCESPGWFGITCGMVSTSSSSGGPPTTRNVITEIRLPRNNLQGPIPPEISLLAYDGPRAIQGVGDLYHLDVSYNPYLTNELDVSPSASLSSQSWISYLGTHLEVLNYGTTLFGSNGIPGTSLPSSLIEYDCSYIDYTGPLRQETFENLNSLQWLMLDGNHYNSDSNIVVPASITELSNLKYLYIRNASLTSDLSYLQNMTSSLVEHAVDNNPNLVGSIPTDLASLPNLKSFSASDCGLTGTLPTNILAMTNLVQLWLYGNQQLVGTIPIPDEFYTSDNLRNMRILAIEDTSIKGIMPFSVCLEKEFDTDGSFLSTLSADCNDNIDCDAFFPDCCTCCGRKSCGT